MGRKLNWTLEQQLLDGRTISADGCWLWREKSKKRGYGKLTYNYKTIDVHRAAAHVWLGLDLDSPLLALHKCPNKHCFNPEHLYIGNQSRNILDAVSAGTHSKSRNKHCTKGHPFDDVNTMWYTSKEGWHIRFCRECNKQDSKEYYRKTRSLTV